MVYKWLFLVLLTPYVGWLIVAYNYHFLDGVNLLIHEAGHVVFSLFGRTAHFLGGTLLQLILPAAFTISFFLREQRYEAGITGIWFCESVMYTAEYMADAQAQRLPLVGGHIHDWHWLLSRWGVLSYSEGLGTVLHGAASVGAVFCVLAAGATLYRKH